MRRQRLFPLITEVKRGSLDDGPGIRSVVFFKGCRLRCVFCHNPENQVLRSQVLFRPALCILCGACLGVCTRGAISLDVPTRVLHDTCDGCGLCALACPSGALRTVGEYRPAAELTDLLLRDRDYFYNSGGGVTASGGECMLFPRYLGELAERLHTQGVHFAIETGGYFSWPAVSRRVLPHIDLVFYDVKLADAAEHRRHTGRGNDVILKNLAHLLGTSIPVHVRVPLVPGVTATRENLGAIVRLAYDLGAPDLTLLPYNPLGLDTAAQLGCDTESLSRGFMDPADVAELEAYVGTLARRLRRGARRISAPGGRAPG